MPSSEPFVRPDAKAFLDALAAMGGRPAAEVTLDEVRQGYAAMHAMADAPARELAVIRDLSCPGPAGEIPLRLYDKRETREAGTVIMFFHGGGFVIGNLDTHHNLCTEIAYHMDLPVVSVDYRLAPEHVFPAAVEDCEAATRWVASSPESLGRGATGIVTIGDSAGGNAAIVVTQQFMKQPAAVPVVLQVPIFPVTSDVFGSASIEEFAEGYVLTKATMEFFDTSYAPVHDDPRAMPILGQHEGTPPTIIVTASLDPLRDSGRDYAAALSQAGVSHIFHEVVGGTHSFTNLRRAVPSYQGETERIFAAMKLMLGAAA